LLTLEARVVVDAASTGDALQLGTVSSGEGRRALELVDAVGDEHEDELEEDEGDALDAPPEEVAGSRRA
jgi:hypothetical protein